jgi:hypothetical protein
VHDDRQGELQGRKRKSRMVAMFRGDCGEQQYAAYII